MVEAVAVQKYKRAFLPDDFKVSSWEDIQPYLEDLEHREIGSAEALEQWLKDLSEVSTVVGEDYNWRYIQKTRDTENTAYDESYNFFVEHIQPKLMKVNNELNKKLINCPHVNDLDQERYFTYLRSVKNSLELFREENIPILTQIEKQSKKYYEITGKMTVDVDGKELTLQQASKYLESKNRVIRRSVYEKIAERRYQDRDAFDELFDNLLNKRHQVAVNAGFDNYRDYKLQSLGRFDYGPDECAQFHDAVEKEIVPLVNDLMKFRQEKLGVKSLRPYDVSVSLGEKDIPVPFEDVEDLVGKSIKCLAEVDPFFGGCLKTMNEMGYLDLDSRKGKAPGGYNCGLPESKVPFIFMNAASTASDVRTMLHEGGHAVHSFLMNDLEYDFDTNINSEEAELASMSMELFAIDHYGAFYKDENDRKQAIYSALEIMMVLIPWIALIDKFQHWLYLNPGHSREERKNTWVEYHKRFSSDVIDWSGLEQYRETMWHKQLHIFLIPFYYIEYGIAQLGAIGMWRNFIQDREEAIANYKKALSLGSTATLPKVYETAGVPFDFSRDYIRDLREFVKSKMN